ncbi:biotin-dependent carboxyltransferase family protein [Gracilimonas sp.]|uniref:5-oxoprolinase subunit C family protein n=1 Tax=Gracilimonas sp. TaxID=1974203 RepID=UPI003D148E18
MGSLEVLDGGLLTTIQDGGRFGYRQYGVPVSGAMDDYAYRLANQLVGNASDLPVLEMTLNGGRYRFNSDAVIAITGADMLPKINGEDISLNTSLEIKSGDIISFDYCQTGCRSYLAIRGQLDIKEVLGSCSTYLTGKFGGFEGRALKEGDVLSWTESEGSSIPERVPEDRFPYYSSKVELRILEGPEWSWLSQHQKEQFLNTEFDVSPDSNRMGIRLKGDSIKPIDHQMVSGPVIPGTIQLPESGRPIIIMKDGQAVGGYPRIAKIADADLWRAGQLWSGVQLTFRKINREEANKLSAFQKNLLYNQRVID